MTETQETDCLKCNPFEGDFGSPGDKVLKDKIVTARKAGACGMCRQEIRPGERVRTLAAVFDGSLFNYRWCEKCCEAMAASWTDNGDAWTARVALARMGPNVELTGAAPPQQGVRAMTIEKAQDSAAPTGAASAVERRVMPLDDMLPMVGSGGGKFAMKFNPEHQQHGWIFYDNYGQWVTLRRALPHEIERAKAIIEMRKVMAGVECKA